MHFVTVLIFAVPLVSILLWFFLCYKIFELLRTRYPDTYLSLGEPSIIMRNGSRQQALLMRFLFKKEWKSLSDRQLSFYCRGLFVFYLTYVLFIACLVFYVLMYR